ncbi:hypothetical protein HK100_002004 [Physocladia obscura]|uniref:Ankyrin n=1 Tax=Physocladia obscura TaxID=109957 RepID=A0AAD5XE54_9FUNG|nr:hypothetical protein HK100_002004 [Physocladia obscura]
MTHGMFVALEGHDEIVEYIWGSKNGSLLDCEAHLNAVVKHACFLNNVKIVKLMLKNISLDPGFDDQVCWRVTCQTGGIALAKFLLQDERVDPSVLENAALLLAAKRGHVSIVKMLMNDQRVNPGSIEIVRLLLQDPTQRIDPALNNSLAFFLAVTSGSAETREYGDPRVDPLLQASKKGFTDVVNLLLKHNVDPSARSNQALRFAAEAGNLDIVDCLLRDERVDLSAEQYQAIVAACQNGHVNVLKNLLQTRHLDIRAFGERALTAASKFGHADVIQILLDVPGIDPCCNHAIALGIAVRLNYLEVVKR